MPVRILLTGAGAACMNFDRTEVNRPLMLSHFNGNFLGLTQVTLRPWVRPQIHLRFLVLFQSKEDFGTILEQETLGISGGVVPALPVFLPVPSNPMLPLMLLPSNLEKNLLSPVMGISKVENEKQVQSNTEGFLLTQERGLFHASLVAAQLPVDLRVAHVEPAKRNLEVPKENKRLQKEKQPQVLKADLDNKPVNGPKSESMDYSTCGHVEQQKLEWNPHLVENLRMKKA
ncbi:Methylcytosine dioxygenase TET1 [Plecturocebus cupreus]